MTNVFGPFFLVASSVTKLTKQIRRVQKFLWQILWNLWKRFLGSKRFLKIQRLEKKGNLPSDEKILA